MAPAAAEVGSTANSYEILGKLAVGGMAEIFLARGESVAEVERHVVLKRVLPSRAKDRHFVQMFLDEARLAAQLQHPNIAQVYDIGKLGDSYFFTMEYVHGETVRALLQRSHALERPIPISAVLTIVAGAAAGLQHAHERKGVDGRPLGIVHRDVSPSNLMISYEGNVKLVDFGVAKAERRGHETESGAVKGKISYLSPEQARGSAALDRRSDLFSLGIVMWELLTLGRLYKRASDFDNMLAIIEEPPVPPSQFRADVPRELDALVMRLLEKSPDARFQTADELHAAVEALAVRTGSALAAASLSRFVRELFGERPEPWIEMRSHSVHAEAVTVTSEPIPPELSVTPVDAIDRQLRAVPDLSLPDQVSTTRERPWAREPTAPPELPTPLYVRASPQPAEPQAPAQPAAARHIPIAVLALGFAVVAAIVLAVVLAGSGPQLPAPSEPASLAGAPARREIDAGATEEPAPPPASAPIDAASAEPPLPAPAPPSSSPASPHAAEPVRPAPRPRTSAPHASTTEDLTRQFEAGRYGDVAAACSASASLASHNAPACVLAACRVHDIAHARRWLDASGDRRAALVRACAAVGTALEPARPSKPDDADSDDEPASKPEPSPRPERPEKPAKPDCAVDPLDCQR